MLSLKDF